MRIAIQTCLFINGSTRSTYKRIQNKNEKKDRNLNCRSALIAIVYAYRIYTRIYLSNVTETAFVYIPTDTEFEDFLPLIEPYLKNPKGFVWVARRRTTTTRFVRYIQN